MGRPVWKGPYVAVELLRDVMALAKKYPDWWSKGRFLGQKAPEYIKTKCRSSTILPDFLYCKFGVHNGKDYIPVEIREPMIGLKLAEFAMTKKPYLVPKKDPKQLQQQKKKK